MSETTHSWASPDPEEYDPEDAEDTDFKRVCRPETPWDGARGIEHVFHPHSYVLGVDYVCSVCGTRTNREPAKVPRLDPNRPTCDRVAPLVAALYSKPDGGAGCCLHIVLDDGNNDDASVDFCVEHAIHDDCRAFARILRRMSKTQRAAVRARYDEENLDETLAEAISRLFPEGA